MSALATRRWLNEGTVWFAVSGIDPELDEAAARVLMDYEHVGPQWQRGYPADAPHLEQAWPSFARHIEAVLRQGARLDPVPWRAFCGARIEWIGGARPFVDEPLPADFGPMAASRLETVTFGDWPVRVPPLDLQRAVSQRRGLADRVAMIDALGP